MSRFTVYVKDMYECLDGRLFLASIIAGILLISSTAYSAHFSLTVQGNDAPWLLTFTLIALSVCAALIGLGVFRVLYRNVSPIALSWFSALLIAAVSFLSMFYWQEWVYLVLIYLLWFAIPWFWAELLRECCLLSLRRRIALAAISCICAALLFGVMMLIPPMVDCLILCVGALIFPIVLEKRESDIVNETEDNETKAKSVHFDKRFACTIIVYAMLWAFSMGFPFWTNIQSYGVGAMGSALAIVLLSFHKGLWGSVEDADSAYKPAAILMTLGFFIIGFPADWCLVVGKTLVSAGFAVFFVYYVPVIGNHVWKFKGDAMLTSIYALLLLFIGLSAGLVMAVVFWVFFPDARLFSSLLSLALICFVLWIVVEGRYFANEPDKAENVFEFNPPAVQPLSDSEETRLEEFAKNYGISKRELDVVRLLAKGRNVPFICDELFIAKSTVQTHIKNIYAKTGVSSRQELLDILESKPE